MQMAETVDRIGQTIRKLGIGLVGPALLAQARNRVRDGDRAFELLERPIDHGAMRPRAVMRDVEMIAARLGRKPGRAIGGDAVAKPAVDTLERAALGEFLRRIAFDPLTVAEIAHCANLPGYALVARMAPKRQPAAR